MMRANRMAMMNDDGSEPWDPYSGNKQQYKCCGDKEHEHSLEYSVKKNYVL